jgi:hypothetical protein
MAMATAAAARKSAAITTTNGYKRRRLNGSAQPPTAPPVTSYCKGFAPQFPASSPFATAVGSTALVLQMQGRRQAGQTAHDFAEVEVGCR